MNLPRALMYGIVFVFACAGLRAADSNDLDVKALKAKLAEQEARLNERYEKLYKDSGYKGSKEEFMRTLPSGSTINTRYRYLCKEGVVRAATPPPKPQR